MKDGRQATRSDLILVRIWVEEPGREGAELRGKVHRAVSGEAHYLRNLPELADIMRSMMPGGRTARGTNLPQPGTGTEEDKGNTYPGVTGEEVTKPANSD